MNEAGKTERLAGPPADSTAPWAILQIPGASPPKLAPGLTGVPETMLWTLYDRACAAKRSGAAFADPECLRIFSAIDYDFEGQFGPPTGLFAARAAAVDAAVRQWLRIHPSGFVVSLGEGLETQASRVDNGHMRWLSVDLPEAMRVRERFITPGGRFGHFAGSAAEQGWIDKVDSTADVFIIAQGLFMYLEPEAVRDILAAARARFPLATIVFDLVPRSLSAATLRGEAALRRYVVPQMPWGLDRNEAIATLRRWLPGVSSVRRIRYRCPSRRPQLLEDLLEALLARRNNSPSLIQVMFG
jgi:O-methyltransferase involved in polyketide biosynthesis